MRQKLLGIVLCLWASSAQAYDLSVIKDRYTLELREQRDLGTIGRAGIGLEHIQTDTLEGGGVTVLVAPELVKRWGFILDVPLSISGVGIVDKALDYTYATGLFYQAMCNLQYTLWHLHVGAMYGLQWAHNSKLGTVYLEQFEGDLTRVYVGVSF